VPLDYEQNQVHRSTSFRRPCHLCQIHLEIPTDIQVSWRAKENKSRDNLTWNESISQQSRRKTPRFSQPSNPTGVIQHSTKENNRREAVIPRLDHKYDREDSPEPSRRITLQAHRVRSSPRRTQLEVFNPCCFGKMYHQNWKSSVLLTISK